MSHRLARVLILFLAALLLLASACSASPSTPGNSRLSSLPTPATAEDAATQNSTAPLLNAAQLQAVYRLILQRFVDRIDDAILLEAAVRGVQESLADEGALPLDLDVVDLAPAANGDPDRDWLAFARSYDALTQKYPDWAAQVPLDHRVLTRMMESLADGHSLFVTPEEVQRRNETGYSGIGIRLARPSSGQAPRIAEVFPGTPAAQQGLKAGDRIVAVEGQAITGLPLAQVVDLIRGPQGTTVSLELERLGASSHLQVSITRHAVDIPLVLAVMEGPIGYVRIRDFSDPVPRMLVNVAQEFERQGVRAWVLDLRGNPGGRVNVVQAVAGMFVGARQIGIEVNRTRERAPLVAQDVRLVGDVPLAVLIDGESTSGAEILSAALREYRQAVLVGERTAGNVAVAEEHPLPDGSAIQLTVRRFLGPSGGQLDRVGVQPDLAVPMTDADLAAGRDPQLDKAVEVLQDRLR
ncbi:MAG: PDZ domain-containing protein [Chloroflexi bacterium]|nr:PDZ domain-containing protein [Chloroflexota bacterium]